MTALRFGLAMFWALFGCGKKPDAVVCVVNYGGEARRLEFPATESPYTVKTVDVAQRFAFKAIYLREARQRDVISVYTYQQTSAGPRLLHEAKYKASLLAASGGAHGFTGRQLVYSSDERELEYFCQLSP